MLSDQVHALPLLMRALMGTALPPLEIAQRAMAISAARCVYSNLFLWVWGGWRVLLSE